MKVKVQCCCGRTRPKVLEHINTNLSSIIRNQNLLCYQLEQLVHILNNETTENEPRLQETDDMNS